jgi:adenylate cyclase
VEGTHLPTVDTASANPTHRLAAIMFSDIAGYTAIMGRDEQEALRALDAHRGVLRTVLPQFKGRLIGEVGDGTLCSFHSAIDAVNCASEVQSKADSPELKLRIGIHLGDVLFTNNTVVGDGVNVASRIHGLAPPGGICVSATVYDEIRNKPGIHAKALGQHRLKNVSRPIGVYLVSAAGLAAEGPSQRNPRWRPIAITIAVGVAILVVAAYGLMRWRSQASNLASSSGASRRIRSIAVLPLDNFSGDPNQEYFADGMTDELTTDLASFSGLRVISRGSAMQYKGEHRPPTPQIAKALNVDAVVEGSVMRVGDRVRITAQLIDAPTDRHLWAKSYERDSRDVLALQDEVALVIAKEIDLELTPGEQARFANSRTVNPEAHDAYLRGRSLLSSYSEGRVRSAIGQFEQAIKLDPSFAPAYTGLADAYVYGGDFYFPATDVIPKAKVAVEKALQLDPDLAEAHSSLATFKMFYEFDFPGAEKEFQRAIELNHNYAEAHHQYGYLLTFVGRFDESERELQRAIDLDPLSAGTVTDLGAPLVFQGKYAASAEQCRKGLELDPDFYFAQFALGWLKIQEGKPAEAIPELEKARLMHCPPFVTGWLGFAYGITGQRAKAQAILAELDQLSAHQFVSPWCPAIVYIGLGDKQRALDDLEKAYEVRSQWLLFLKSDKTLDPIRSEPRFIDVLKKVHLDK